MLAQRVRPPCGGHAPLPAVTELSSTELSIPHEASRAEPRAARRAALARAALRACRPRQWSKNVLVLAAPAAGGALSSVTVGLEVAGAIVAFCMLASSTYLLNDVRDIEQDRAHHRKRTRPIASGALPVRVALALAALLALGGLGIALAVRPLLAGVGCGYLTLTACYSLWLRHVIVADMLAIAAGFVLRAVAGGAATGVGLSRWFLLVTSFGAVFVVAGKRHAELFGRAHEMRNGLTRTTLRLYSEPALQAMLAAAAAGTIAAYSLWAFGRPEHGPWYEGTIVPVVLWLARYAVLVARGAGEAPEELILRDRALLVLTLTWTALFLGGVYVGR
jgi:decaprenyl-phosphate phosphoribosyltransferase